MAKAMRMMESLATSPFVKITITPNNRSSTPPTSPSSIQLQQEIEAFKEKSHHSQHNQSNYESLANDMIKIGELFVRELLFSEAITWYKEALCIEEIYYPDDVVRISEIMFHLGNVYLMLNEYENALEYFLEARAIMFLNNPYHEIRDAEILFKIGIVYQHKGCDQEAFESFEKGLHIHETYLSDSASSRNPSCIENKSELLIHRGELLEKGGQYRQALNDYQQCYSILEDYSCLLTDQSHHSPRSSMSITGGDSEHSHKYSNLSISNVDIMLADIEYHINHLESLLQLRADCIALLLKYIADREKETKFDICSYSRREKIEAAKYVIHYLNTHAVTMIGEIVKTSEYLKHKGPLTDSRLGQIFNGILTSVKRCRRQFN